MPDRFTNPEDAEAATLAAAAESEFAPSIDETVADDIAVSEAAEASANAEAPAANEDLQE